jgi:hypothetical protein
VTSTSLSRRRRLLLESYGLSGDRGVANNGGKSEISDVMVAKPCVCFVPSSGLSHETAEQRGHCYSPLLLQDAYQADLAALFFNLSASYTASTRDCVFAGALRTTEYSIWTCFIRSFVGFSIIGSTIVALLCNRPLTA